MNGKRSFNPPRSSSSQPVSETGYSGSSVSGTTKNQTRTWPPAVSNDPVRSPSRGSTVGSSAPGFDPQNFPFTDPMNAGQRRHTPMTMSRVTAVSPAHFEAVRSQLDFDERHLAAQAGNLANGKTNGLCSDDDIMTMHPSAILEPLSKVRAYMKQISTTIERLKSNGNGSEANREMLEKMMSAYDGFKEQETQYLMLLQKIIPMQALCNSANNPLSSDQDSFGHIDNHQTPANHSAFVENSRAKGVNPDAAANQRIVAPALAAEQTDELALLRQQQKSLAAAANEQRRQMEGLRQERDLLQKMLYQQKQLKALQQQQEACAEEMGVGGAIGQNSLPSGPPELSEEAVANSMANRADLISREVELNSLRSKIEMLNRLREQASLQLGSATNRVTSISSNSQSSDQYDRRSGQGSVSGLLNGDVITEFARRHTAMEEDKLKDLRHKKQQMDQLLDAGELGGQCASASVLPANSDSMNDSSSGHALANGHGFFGGQSDDSLDPDGYPATLILNGDSASNACETGGNPAGSVPVNAISMRERAVHESLALQKQAMESLQQERCRFMEQIKKLNDIQRMLGVERSAPVLPRDMSMDLSSSSDHQQLGGNVRGANARNGPVLQNDSGSSRARQNLIDIQRCNIASLTNDFGSPELQLNNSRGFGNSSTEALFQMDMNLRKRTVPDTSVAATWGDSQPAESDDDNMVDDVEDSVERIPEVLPPESNNQRQRGDVSSSFVNNPWLPSFRRNNELLDAAIGATPAGGRISAGSQSQPRHSSPTCSSAALLQRRHSNNYEGRSNSSQVSGNNDDDVYLANQGFSRRPPLHGGFAAQSSANEHRHRPAARVNSLNLEQQYHQLQGHMDSIRGIFETVIQERQGTPTRGPNRSGLPAPSNFMVPNQATNALGNLPTFPWEMNAWNTSALAAQQSHLMLSLLNCQQQLQMQQEEMRYLHQICQDIGRGSMQNSRIFSQAPSQHTFSQELAGSCHENLPGAFPDSPSTHSFVAGRTQNNLQSQAEVTNQTFAKNNHQAMASCAAVKSRGQLNRPANHALVVASLSSGDGSPVMKNERDKTFNVFPPVMNLNDRLENSIVTPSAGLCEEASSCDIEVVPSSQLQAKAVKKVAANFENESKIKSNAMKEQKNLIGRSTSGEVNDIGKITSALESLCAPQQAVSSEIGKDGSVDLLRATIYSEAALFISQNESRPNFILDLFGELRQVHCDFLRTRILDAVRQLVQRWVTNSNDGSSLIENDAHRLSERQVVTNNVNMSAAAGATDERVATPLRDVVKIHTNQGAFVANEQERTFGHPAKEFSSPSCGGKNPKRFEHLEEISNVKDENRYADVLIKDKSDKSAPAIASLKLDASADTGTSGGQAIVDVNVSGLEQQIQGIMTELIPFMKENSNQLCTPHILAYLRKLILKLAHKCEQAGAAAEHEPRSSKTATSTDEGMNDFLHRQLSTILDDTLIKFAGQNDELLADVSEVVFNELAFFRLMHNIGPKHKMILSRQSSLLTSSASGGEADESSQSEAADRYQDAVNSFRANQSSSDDPVQMDGEDVAEADISSREPSSSVSTGASEGASASREESLEPRGRAEAYDASETSEEASARTSVSTSRLARTVGGVAANFPVCNGVGYPAGLVDNELDVDRVSNTSSEVNKQQGHKKPKAREGHGVEVLLSSPLTVQITAATDDDISQSSVSTSLHTAVSQNHLSQRTGSFDSRETTSSDREIYGSLEDVDAEPESEQAIGSSQNGSQSGDLSAQQEDDNSASPDANPLPEDEMQFLPEATPNSSVVEHEN